MKLPENIEARLQAYAKKRGFDEVQLGQMRELIIKLVKIEVAERRRKEGLKVKTAA